jgi:hypothetical protein
MSKNYSPEQQQIRDEALKEIKKIREDLNNTNLAILELLSNFNNKLKTENPLLNAVNINNVPTTMGLITSIIAKTPDALVSIQQTTGIDLKAIDFSKFEKIIGKETADNLNSYSKILENFNINLPSITGLIYEILDPEIAEKLGFYLNNTIKKIDHALKDTEKKEKLIDDFLQRDVNKNTPDLDALREYTLKTIDKIFLDNESNINNDIEKLITQISYDRKYNNIRSKLLDNISNEKKNILQYDTNINDLKEKLKNSKDNKDKIEELQKQINKAKKEKNEVETKANEQINLYEKELVTINEKVRINREALMKSTETIMKKVKKGIFAGLEQKFSDLNGDNILGDDITLKLMDLLSQGGEFGILQALLNEDFIANLVNDEITKKLFIKLDNMLIEELSNKYELVSHLDDLKKSLTELQKKYTPKSVEYEVEYDAINNIILELGDENIEQDYLNLNEYVNKLIDAKIIPINWYDEEIKDLKINTETNDLIVNLKKIKLDDNFSWIKELSKKHISDIKTVSNFIDKENKKDNISIDDKDNDDDKNIITQITQKFTDELKQYGSTLKDNLSNETKIYAKEILTPVTKQESDDLQKDINNFILFIAQNIDKQENLSLVIPESVVKSFENQILQINNTGKSTCTIGAFLKIAHTNQAVADLFVNYYENENSKFNKLAKYITSNAKNENVKKAFAEQKFGANEGNKYDECRKKLQGKDLKEYKSLVDQFNKIKQQDPRHIKTIKAIQALHRGKTGAEITKNLLASDSLKEITKTIRDHLLPNKNRDNQNEIFNLVDNFFADVANDIIKIINNDKYKEGSYIKPDNYKNMKNSLLVLDFFRQKLLKFADTKEKLDITKLFTLEKDGDVFNKMIETGLNIAYHFYYKDKSPKEKTAKFFWEEKTNKELDDFFQKAKTSLLKLPRNKDEDDSSYGKRLYQKLSNNLINNSSYKKNERDTLENICNQLITNYVTKSNEQDGWASIETYFPPEKKEEEEISIDLSSKSEISEETIPSETSSSDDLNKLFDDADKAVTEKNKIEYQNTLKEYANSVISSLKNLDLNKIKLEKGQKNPTKEQITKFAEDNTKTLKPLGNEIDIYNKIINNYEKFNVTFFESKMEIDENVKNKYLDSSYKNYINYSSTKIADNINEVINSDLIALGKIIEIIFTLIYDLRAAVHGHDEEDKSWGKSLLLAPAKILNSTHKFLDNTIFGIRFPIGKLLKNSANALTSYKKLYELQDQYYNISEEAQKLEEENENIINQRHAKFMGYDSIITRRHNQLKDKNNLSILEEAELKYCQARIEYQNSIKNGDSQELIEKKRLNAVMKSEVFEYYFKAYFYKDIQNKIDDVSNIKLEQDELISIEKLINITVLKNKEKTKDIGKGIFELDNNFRAIKKSYDTIIKNHEEFIVQYQNKSKSLEALTEINNQLTTKQKTLDQENKELENKKENIQKEIDLINKKIESQSQLLSTNKQQIDLKNNEIKKIATKIIASSQIFDKQQQLSKLEESQEKLTFITEEDKENLNEAQKNNSNNLAELIKKYDSLKYDILLNNTECELLKLKLGIGKKSENDLENKKKNLEKFIELNKIENPSKEQTIRFNELKKELNINDTEFNEKKEKLESDISNLKLDLKNNNNDLSILKSIKDNAQDFSKITDQNIKTNKYYKELKKIDDDITKINKEFENNSSLDDNSTIKINTFKTITWGEKRDQLNKNFQDLVTKQQGILKKIDLEINILEKQLENKNNLISGKQTYIEILEAQQRSSELQSYIENDNRIKELDNNIQELNKDSKFDLDNITSINKDLEKEQIKANEELKKLQTESDELSKKSLEQANNKLEKNTEQEEILKKISGKQSEITINDRNLLENEADINNITTYLSEKNKNKYGVENSDERKKNIKLLQEKSGEIKKLTDEMQIILDPKKQEKQMIDGSDNIYHLSLYCTASNFNYQNQQIEVQTKSLKNLNTIDKELNSIAINSDSKKNIIRSSLPVIGFTGTNIISAALIAWTVIFAHFQEKWIPQVIEQVSKHLFPALFGTIAGLYTVASNATVLLINKVKSNNDIINDKKQVDQFIENIKQVVEKEAGNITGVKDAEDTKNNIEKTLEKINKKPRTNFKRLVSDEKLQDLSDKISKG